MSHHSHRMLTSAVLKKRKETESTLAGTKVIIAMKPSAPAQAAAQLTLDNRILAGYMAYEFLTRGTLLGQRLEGLSVPGTADTKRVKLEAGQSEWKENGGYSEVACILKMEGARIPGIVNPTQLSRWIQM